MNYMNEQQYLEDRIYRWNESYRYGNPEVSDKEYDEHLDRLKERYPDSKLLKRGVIEQLKQSRKEKLPLPMYSLNKLKSAQEVKSWLQSNNIPQEEMLVITPKFDGISLVVDEFIKKAWTRGDGEIGQKSDLHYRRILSNEYLEGSFHFYSYGEAIMSKKSFEKYKDKYANPRNLVAGLFNRDEAGKELEDVNYISYGCSVDEDKVHQIGRLNQLVNNVKCESLVVRCKEFLQHADADLEQAFTNLYTDWGKDYNIDGLVIDINSKELRQRLGREENMNPKYARAIKLPQWSQEATTKVKSITWQVSKQGKLKPVINIEPVELAGAMISNVTGYNAQYVFDNNIAEESVIRIIRSGDVIPKHIETISKTMYYVDKEKMKVSLCPSCNTPTKWDSTGVELICTNSNCKEKQIAKLVHFFTTLEVEEFGEPSIRKFYDYDLMTIDSILNVTKEDLLEIDGWGEKSADKLLSQFQKLKQEGVPFAKLLHALDCMDGKIGEKTIQSIFDNFELLSEMFLHFSKNPLPFKFYTEELIKIDGVAEISAMVFQKGISRYFFEQLDKLEVKIKFIQTPKLEQVGNKLKSYKICFTGIRPSKDQEQQIQSQGGEIVSGVSKNTTHLVVKDTSSTSSKMQKAKELGVEILSMNEFLKLL